MDDDAEFDSQAYAPFDDDHELGCCFPDECCMPGLHMKSECFTPEMHEQLMEEMNDG